MYLTNLRTFPDISDVPQRNPSLETNFLKNDYGINYTNEISILCVYHVIRADLFAFLTHPRPKHGTRGGTQASDPVGSRVAMAMAKTEGWMAKVEGQKAESHSEEAVRQGSAQRGRHSTESGWC